MPKKFQKILILLTFLWTPILFSFDHPTESHLSDRLLITHYLDQLNFFAIDVAHQGETLGLPVDQIYFDSNSEKSFIVLKFSHVKNGHDTFLPQLDEKQFLCEGRLNDHIVYQLLMSQISSRRGDAVCKFIKNNLLPGRSFSLIPDLNLRSISEAGGSRNKKSFNRSLIEWLVRPSLAANKGDPNCHAGLKNSPPKNLMEFHQKVSENQIYQDLTRCLANSLNEVFKNLPIEIKKMIPNVIEPKDFWKVITTEVKAFQDFVFQVQEMGQSLIDEVSKIENSSDILRQMQKKAEGISVSPKELVQGVCLVGADLIKQAIISLAVPGGVLKLSSVILSASQKLKSLFQLQKWIGKFEKLKSTKIIEEITLCRIQK